MHKTIYYIYPTVFPNLTQLNKSEIIPIFKKVLEKLIEFYTDLDNKSLIKNAHLMSIDVRGCHLIMLFSLNTKIVCAVVVSLKHTSSYPSFSILLEHSSIILAIFSEFGQYFNTMVLYLTFSFNYTP